MCFCYHGSVFLSFVTCFHFFSFSSSFFLSFLLFQIHVCFVFILSFFYLKKKFFFFFPVWTKAPPALFLQGILPVSDCMFLMHFGSLSTLLADTLLSFFLFLSLSVCHYSLLISSRCPSHLLLIKCHRLHF